MVSLVAIFGALSLVGSGFGYLILPWGVKMGLGMFINLKENGMVFPAYVNPPVPSMASYYIYEIKNPKEVLKGARMKLYPRGPYFYKLMYLDESKSANLDERFWTMNPIPPAALITIRTLVLDKIPFKRISEPIVFNTVNVLLDNFKERLIVKKSPRVLLQGRKVELLESLTNLADRFGLKSLIPPGPPENTFGVAHFQNASVDVIEIYTGVGATKDKFGEVKEWKNAEKMSIWKGKCNEITGTNGELYKPYSPNGKPLRVFIPQFCRSFDLDPVGTKLVTIQDGLKAYEYQISPRLYQGAKSNPSNRCFCSDTKTMDCQYDGLIRMTPCFFDAPLFFARTNFKGVDRRIRSLIDEDSLTYALPDKQSFYLEPNSGSILKVNLTLMATFKVMRQPYMRDLANIQNLTYAPMFSATETIELPLSLTMPLKGLQLMLDYYKPVFMGTALFGLVILVIKVTMWGRKSESPSALVSPQQASSPG